MSLSLEEPVTTETRFDPSKYLTSLKGNPYLEVKWRLLWFRTEHPDGEIQTELVHWTPELAVVKATVRIPGGGSATAYGTETKADFADHTEKSETKAIGRALAHLGYGTQFAPELDMNNPDGTPHVVDAPVSRGRAYQNRVEASTPSAPKAGKGYGAPYRQG